MAYFVEVYCRIAIRLCVGYFEDGRERYRTVNIWNVRRDVTADQVAAVVRALEPVLDGRVVRVLVIRKDRLMAWNDEPSPLTFAVIASPEGVWRSHSIGAGDAIRPLSEAAKGQKGQKRDCLDAPYQPRAPDRLFSKKVGVGSCT